MGHESPTQTERPDSVNIALRDKLRGHYYGMKQLGPAGPGSDYNARSIYCGVDRLVATFNSGFGSDRHHWTDKHEREFNTCLLALQNLADDAQHQVTESGGKEQTTSRDTKPSTDGTHG